MEHSVPVTSDQLAPEAASLQPSPAPAPLPAAQRPPSRGPAGLRRLAAIVVLAGGRLAVGGVAAVNAASPAPSSGTPAAPGATAAPGTTATPTHPCNRSGGTGAPSA